MCSAEVPSGSRAVAVAAALARPAPLRRPGLAAAVAALAALAVALPARADMISLVAVRDNTLFEDPDGALSGGQAQRLFAGRSNQTENNARRALLAFDFASLPTGAVIQSVDLRLRVVQVVDNNPWNFGLHRVTSSWGEGASGDGERGGGGGAAAQTGDATWLHRFYDGTPWTNPGGDFVAQASADISVALIDTFYTWSSTAQLVADVQGWVDDPGGNHGWLLLGEEGQPKTAKAFASSEYSLNPDFRPTLFVNYTVVPEAGTLALVALGGVAFLPCAAARRRGRTSGRAAR